jgi:hypothetical protein
MMIEWNKVTWYSKLAALALFVLLPFIGFFYGTKYGALTESPQSTKQGAVTYYNDISFWQTDHREDTGWSIAYPIDFPTNDIYGPKPDTDWSLSANGAPGIRQFTLQVPKLFEPQTNFADALLTVGVSRNNTALKTCLAPIGSGGAAGTVSTTTINGIPFAVSTGTGAGAGNFYETTSYHALHAGQCFAVEYTIHSTQIANYPAEYGLHEFDPTKIRTLLDKIVGTFRII